MAINDICEHKIEQLTNDFFEGKRYVDPNVPAPSLKPYINQT